MRSLAPFVFLLLALCPACERTPERVTPKFAWPEEGSVKVKEFKSKRGQKAVVSYELTWKPDGEGTGSILSNRGFRFESINGVSAAHPEIAAELKRFAGLEAVYPDMHIDLEGNLIRFKNWDQIMNQTLELVGELDAGSEENRAQLEQAFTGPVFRKVMEEKTRAYWDVWVGAWVGFDMMTGESETFETTSEVIDGIELPGDVTITCNDVLYYEGEKCFFATIETEWDTAGIKDYLARFVDALFEGGDIDFPVEAIESFRRYDRVAGTYEIATLRPRDVKTYTSIEVTARDDPEDEPETRTRLEEHRYVFDWPDS